MSGDLNRSVVLGLGTLVLLALVGITALTKDLSRRLEDVAAAATDNVQWVIAQIEVEYLVFHAALLRAEVDGAPALPDLRTRFDVFYSRIGTISNSQVFATLRDEPEFSAALAEVRGFLDDTVPIVDGPDVGLLANLFEIEERSAALRPAVRTLGLTGITHFAATGDARRAGVEATLGRVVALSAGLIGLLLLVSGLLLFLMSRLRRSSQIAEASRARMSAVVASSRDAVIVANRLGVIVDFNSAAEETFGYSRAEILGRTMSETIVPPHLRAAHDAGMRRYLDTGVPHVIGAGRVQLEAVRKDGALFPVELSISAAASGGEEVFVSFLRDITDRLANEAELREARDTALAGERAKARFIAVMSHEMRTPLNGILGTLDLIDRAALPEQERAFLDVIRQSGDLLLRHVNDVLDIAKLDAGQAGPELETIDLPAILREVMAGQSALAEAAGNTLRLDLAKSCARPMRGDPRRLRQILFNLIGNAVKFTRAGEITVSAQRLGAGDDVELQVQDTGIGIPEDAQARIFDEFVTLDAGYDRQSGGTGLGLAITRRTVQLLGGTMGVESEPGAGSVFWVRLPMPETGGAPAAPPTESAEGAWAHGDMRVLVAEDNEINRMILSETLTRAGVTVVLASDGQQAVDAAAGTGFDAILMDISMPRMNGLDAARAIRAGAGPNRQTPILAITAHALPDEISRFTEAGITSVLTKPIDRAALLAALADPQTGPAQGILPGRVSLENLARLSDEIGRERFDGLLTAFIAQADRAVAELASSTKGSVPDADLLAEIHRLAGSSGTFGAHALHGALARLEDRGKSGNMDEVWAGLPDLPAIWAESRPVYAAHGDR